MVKKQTVSSTRVPSELAAWVRETFGNINYGLAAMVWFSKAAIDDVGLPFSDEVLKEIAVKVGNLDPQFWADIEVVSVMVGGANGALIKTSDVNECFAMMVKIQKLKVKSE